VLPSMPHRMQSACGLLLSSLACLVSPCEVGSGSLPLPEKTSADLLPVCLACPGPAAHNKAASYNEEALRERSAAAAA
jgi:hypothetical protein